MAKLIMGMGLPGSGKSTNLKRFAEKYAYDYISFDTVREMLGLSRAQSSTSEVFEHICSRMLQSYRAGKTVVLDGTFLNDYRKQVINFARENGIRKIQGVFISIPEEHAWARVQSRAAVEKTTRKLFEDRVKHLKNSPPGIADGFNSFFILNENGKLIRAELAHGHAREFKPRYRFA